MQPSIADQLEKKYVMQSLGTVEPKTTCRAMGIATCKRFIDATP